MADLRDFFSLVPACAGVILGGDKFAAAAMACPRVCGGDPKLDEIDNGLKDLSPRVRG